MASLPVPRLSPPQTSHSPRRASAQSVRAELPLSSQPNPSPSVIQQAPWSPFRTVLRPQRKGGAFLSRGSLRRVSTQRIPVLDDVQARRPSTHVSLSRVGVTGVEKVVHIKANGDEPQLFY